MLRPAALVLLAAAPLPAQFWAELGNPKVDVNVAHPPGFGMKLHRLAFAPTRNRWSQALVDQAIVGLVQSGQVEVVDRAHLDTILQEQELGASGYLDPATVARLGKLLGPTALVMVNVHRSEISRTSSSENRTVNDKPVVTRTATATMDFDATVQVIDLSTGRIVGARQLKAAPSLSTKADNGYPEAPREADLWNLVYGQAKHDILRLFTSWNETRRVTYFNNRNYGMKEAYERLEDKDLAGAEARARQGYEEARADKGGDVKFRARAAYNLGVLQLIQHRYEEALPLLREALDLIPDAGIFRDALKECTDAMRLRDEVLRAERAAMDAPTPRPAPAPAAKGGDPEARLRRLKELHDKGLLTDKEFEAKRAEVLKEL